MHGKKALVERKIPLLRSCERCRRRKQRCDGEQPVCGRCAAHNAECKYRQSGRFRKRFPQAAAAANTADTPGGAVSPQQSSDGSPGLSSLDGSPLAKRARPLMDQTPMLFSVPALTPSTMSSVSPDSGILLTPGVGEDQPAGPSIDPVEILKTCDLPDFSQTIPESTLKQMFALIGHANCEPMLPPNLDLLDPKNMAANCTNPYGIPDSRYLSPSIPDSGHYCRSAHGNSGLRWSKAISATLCCFAHLAIAAHEAQLSSRPDLQGVSPSLEPVCYEKALQEFDGGRVVPTVGSSYAMLLLSEYGYQSGRYPTMLEMAENALALVKRIVLRGTMYPWRGAQQGSCDVEYEYVISCFWSVWMRTFTAAQALTKRFRHTNLLQMPDYPRHDLCHYAANSTATIGLTPVDCVEFPPASCAHQSGFSYAATTWQCGVLSTHMHNLYIDLLEKRGSADQYFEALKAWDKRVAAFRASWPQEWDVQMEKIRNMGAEINKVKFHDRVPLDGNYSHLRRRQYSPSPLPNGPPDVRNVGYHMYYQNSVDAGDSWLLILHIIYESMRLRTHRIALAFLHREENRSLHGIIESGILSASALPRVPKDHRYISDDPMHDALVFHQSRYVCLDSARNLQDIFTLGNMVGFPLDRIGIWMVFAMEYVISIQSSRLSSQDVDTKRDALRRLARLLRQLLTLKHWSGALLVFTSVVKLFIDPKNTIKGMTAYVENSPWESNHILTLLMKDMDMGPREFCAYTLPVVYASMHMSPLPTSMRMRIASLIS
ncbi:hypothetical protein DL89DRAFT_255194 [Linderina pennispora]|uniref:Zn(2)-C6 fungal-type domain-containing protein n=1 Tax=Linderina pennispora TaxID=61395 RepID=A0A1Y1WHJ2_9FUNG|nr:uncharacterized protein DL89DRAFT_255194 [Linderina pennispora]ORX73040.1 hypothetical protein DL89DRAFT_255194 [Linderina pennispora]